MAAPVQLPLPLHYRQARLAYNETGCACTITCTTQPIPLLADRWDSALFLDQNDDLWYVPAPAAAGPALLQIVDAQNPPLRVLFGAQTQIPQHLYAERLQSWANWEHLSQAAQG